MFCTQCGKEIPDNSPHCPFCKHSPAAPAEAQEQTINSWLVPAILVTILCCMPFGIVALIYAARVSALAAAGNVAEAQNVARQARNWTLAGAICGAAVYLITWSFYIVMLIFALDSSR